MNGLTRSRKIAKTNENETNKTNENENTTTPNL